MILRMARLQSMAELDEIAGVQGRSWALISYII